MKRLTILAIAMISMISAYPAMAQSERLSSDYPKWEHLADTPQMGWNSWNCFMTDINEDLIKRKTAGAHGRTWLG